MFENVGRKEESTILDSDYNSDNPEFIALYGRRRVGKTFLIRNTFAKKANYIFL
jgi:AAA+ ATPase superfamily predicted ATPase